MIKCLVLAAIAAFAFVLLPEPAYAWGPGVHISIAEWLLSNLTLLPASVAHTIASHKDAFKYGALSADIFIGKGSTVVPGHSHSIASAILNTIWMSPALNTAIVCDAIVNGTVERVIQRKIEEAKRRNDIAWSILPFSSNAVRTNGFYIWYQLPEPWSGYEFEAHAKKEWVSISCAEQFTVGSPDIAPAARICLTPVSKHELSEGLSRLANILDTGYWSLKENKL